MASLGGVLVRGPGVVFARLAASLAFAICSRRICDELAFGVVSSDLGATSDWRAAFAFAI
jgi:hypothetical protein